MVIKDLYFTITEAAKELNVSRQTIYRWITDGKISTEKVGGIVFIEKNTIRDYARKKSYEAFSQMMDMQLEDTVRRKLGCNSEDKIKEIKADKNYVSTYIITHNNGTSEKVNIKDIEVIMGLNKEEGLRVRDFVLKGVKRTPYKPPKGKKKGGQ